MGDEHIELTKQEFIDRWGSFTVSFSSYYKYKFYFTCTVGAPDNPDGKLSLAYGGDSDGIYRFDVEATDSYLVSDLDWSSGTYQDWKKGVEYSFYD